MARVKSKTFKDSKTFSRAFKQEANDHVEAVGKAAHKFVVSAVHKKIVEINPVLTGLSRNNWNLSLKNPSRKTTATMSSAGTTGAAITPEETSRQRQIEAMIDAAPMGQTVWIANYIKYIVFLNAGTSGKAPAGIVEPAIIGALSGGSDGRMVQQKLL